MVAGKQAWLALMNQKSPTALCRSVVQNRPRLLTRSPAPPGAARSHAAAAPTRRVPWTTNQLPPPPVGPLACRPQQPRRRSTAPWAQTPEQAPPEIGTNQIDHLTAKLRRIPRMGSGHQEHLWQKLQGVHETGSSQCLCFRGARIAPTRCRFSERLDQGRFPCCSCCGGSHESFPASLYYPVRGEARSYPWSRACPLVLAPQAPVGALRFSCSSRPHRWR